MVVAYRGITLGRGACLGDKKVEIVVESDDDEADIVSRGSAEVLGNRVLFVQHFVYEHESMGNKSTIRMSDQMKNERTSTLPDPFVNFAIRRQ